MKKTLNMRQQLAINLRYCYSAIRATKNILESRRQLVSHVSHSSSTIGLAVPSSLAYSVAVFLPFVEKVLCYQYNKSVHSIFNSSCE